jgi:hypothetical protein
MAPEWQLDSFQIQSGSMLNQVRRNPRLDQTRPRSIPAQVR